MDEKLKDSKLSTVQLLNVRQVSELLGFHQRTIWKMASAGELPKPIKIGAKAVRWRLSDLSSFVRDAS